MHQGFSHFPDPLGLALPESRPAPGVAPDPPPWLDPDPDQLELPWTDADMRRCASEPSPHTSWT